VPVAPHAEPFFADGRPDDTDGLHIGVLLVHGFTGSPKPLVPWGRHLAAEGFSVAVPRLPGHGTTWKEMSRTTYADWYGEVERAFEKLHAGCDVVVAGGLSLGGALALHLAEQKGADVAGLVLVNPGLTTYNRLAAIRHLVKYLAPSTSAIRNDIKKPGQDEGAYERVPTRAGASMLDGWLTTIADLPKVTQPLLVFRSAEDHVVPPSSVQIIAGKVSSRDLRERILENSYHVATLDNDAPAIFEESVAFIRRVARQ
jgi:carboxylesterase